MLLVLLTMISRVRHVQVFRSIDSDSVKGFPKDPRDATYKNLVCGKNVLIDMSIHTAYVNAIRAAQHFIYIENQYFFGSSYNWSIYKDLDIWIQNVFVGRTPGNRRRLLHIMEPESLECVNGGGELEPIRGHGHNGNARSGHFLAAKHFRANSSSEFRRN